MVNLSRKLVELQLMGVRVSYPEAPLQDGLALCTYNYDGVGLELTIC
jgi:hypothetical protein